MIEAAEERETRFVRRLVVAILAALCVIAGLLYHWASPPAAKLTDSGFDLTHVDAPKPAAAAKPARAAAGGRSGPATAAVVPAVVPAVSPAAAAAAPSASPAPAATPTPTTLASGEAAPAAKSRTAPASRPETEADVMRRVVGPLDPRSARGIGEKPGLVPRMAMALMDHPALLSALLNNRFVVAGVMAQQRIEQGCRDTRSMEGYLADGRDPAGVGPLADMLNESASHPGATQTIADSALMTAALSDCPSMSQLKDDPRGVSIVLRANPQLASMVMNPTIVAALKTNPAAQPYVPSLQLLQSTLGAMGGQAP